jgi:hypothetical protein
LATQIDSQLKFVKSLAGDGCNRRIDAPAKYLKLWLFCGWSIISGNDDNLATWCRYWTVIDIIGITECLWWCGGAMDRSYRRVCTVPSCLDGLCWSFRAHMTSFMHNSARMIQFDRGAPENWRSRIKPSPRQWKRWRIGADSIEVGLRELQRLQDARKEDLIMVWSEWFPWLCGILLAGSWSRVVVPFQAKRAKDVSGIVRIEVTQGRSKAMTFDNVFGWFWRLVYRHPLTFHRVRYYRMRYLRLSRDSANSRFRFTILVAVLNFVLIALTRIHDCWMWVLSLNPWSNEFLLILTSDYASCWRCIHLRILTQRVLRDSLQFGPNCSPPRILTQKIRAWFSRYLTSEADNSQNAWRLRFGTIIQSWFGRFGSSSSPGCLWVE